MELSKQAVVEWFEQLLSEHPDFGAAFFLVEVRLPSNGVLEVDVDKEGRIRLDELTRLSHLFSAWLEEQGLDVEFSVCSPGLSKPLRHWRQFVREVGQPVTVLHHTGEKQLATLLAADAEQFTLLYQEKQRVPGKKRPALVAREESYPYTAVKSVTLYLGNIRK